MEISWHPSTSGHLGGMLAGMKLPNGHEFKDTEADPGSAFAVTGAKQAETASNLVGGTANSRDAGGRSLRPGDVQLRIRLVRPDCRPLACPRVRWRCLVTSSRMGRPYA